MKIKDHSQKDTCKTVTGHYTKTYKCYCQQRETIH